MIIVIAASRPVNKNSSVAGELQTGFAYKIRSIYTSKSVWTDK